MANVVRPSVGGPGNDVLFGNTVRASVAMIANNCCCQVTNALGQAVVDVNAIDTVGGVKTIPTTSAPSIVLSTADTEGNLALGVPLLTGVNNQCPIVCLTIINCSGSTQAFDQDPSLSNVKRTNFAWVMQDGCSYNFYYDPSSESWISTCGLIGL
ncbi:MAG: hypothetical protein Salg2KO_23240 [Salibacteraceae bacterium]